MSERHGATFGRISRFNHWAAALVFVGILCVGFYLEFGGLEREAKRPLMALHKAAGTLFLLFAAWRVGWRLYQGFPKDVAEMAAWPRLAARLVHWGLLVAVLIMPASGLAMTLFKERSVDVFGLFTIPGFERNDALAGIGHEIHGYAPWVIVALIVVHIAAAVKHHVIDKDEVMRRMTRGS